MSHRTIVLEDIGQVTLYKRKGAKNLKLTVGHNGDIRVTLPLWAPYYLGKQFVQQRRAWLLDKQVQFRPLPNHLRVGKAHHVQFDIQNWASIRSRVARGIITIQIPTGINTNSPEVQTAIQHASIRALKKEAKLLLPDRIENLAKKHGFAYRSVRIKEMRSRWGSCSQHKDIVLNCYLMQLPWELIDYVLLHELVHTRVLAHGAPFWDELTIYVQNLPAIRKTMRSIQPTLHPQSTT
jgi:predicted metal-dependent hydrolase